MQGAGRALAEASKCMVLIGPRRANAGCSVGQGQQRQGVGRQAELQRQGEGRTKANGCRMLAGPRRAKRDEPWRVEASTVTVEHRAIFPSGFCADCHESIEEFSII
jgi:hypothetical protein